MKTNIPLHRPAVAALQNSLQLRKTNLLPFSQPNPALFVDFHEVD
jgi:hypothetical protein